MTDISTDRLHQYKRLYREYRDATTDARREGETAYDYYHSKQLSTAHIRVLRERKQPEIYVNRIAPAVNGILGVLEQAQSDPRAFPRNTDDNGIAEVATDSLRYAADQCRWGRVKLNAARDLMVSGIGAVIVEVNGKKDPVPTIIRNGEFIYDPHSRDADFEDARYLGVAKWMYTDSVKRLYPGADIDPTAIAEPKTLDADDEDKPERYYWADRKRNRVMVVELYILRQQWDRVVYWGGGVLEEGPSPYLDDEGNPACPIVAQSCFVDRDNARYGIVKSMLPIQDEINMRRSRALHMANSRQLKVNDPMGPETSSEVARKEAARPDGVIPFGFESAAMGDLATAQFSLLQEAKSEIERMGPNPAVLGQSASSASGRSQLVRQQAGLTELTPVLGSIEDMELRVYRQMWQRIRQFWDEPKLIRVTDDIGAPKFMAINEPVVERVRGIVQGPDGQPMIGVQEIVVGMRNRPAEMDMDIIVDAVPDTANVQQEQFAELVKLAQMYGPQEVPFDDLLEASNLPRKRELIEKREARRQEAMQAQAEGQGPQAMIAQAMAEAEIAGKQAKAALDGAKAEGQQMDNQINAFQAGNALGAAAGL